MFAIRGAGFGLYGYLPALVGCGQRVVLPERYRARFDERPELAPYAGDVLWEKDEHAALERADGAALALRPRDQAAWVARCLALPRLERLILEKPLAPSPEESARLFESLLRSGKSFRVGYVFRETSWGRRFLEAGGATAVTWTFMAHHFRADLRNWKRSHAAGGGPVRFYGIQLVALLAEAGYREVLSSSGTGGGLENLETWEARFSGPGLPECRVEVLTRSLTDALRVEGPGGAVLTDLREPFETGETAGGPGVLDRRVPILGALCRSLWEPGDPDYAWYGATLDLWRDVEDKFRLN